MDIEARACRVKLLIFDVDGVFTNGQLMFGRDGEVMKEFNAQDGLGISIAHQAGFKTAIITGRESEMVRMRGAELKIADIYQGTIGKVAALAELVNKYKFDLEEVCYAGDDLLDLPVMVKVGLACAVANAAPEVKERAHFVATREGGRGAVREIVEFVLKAQGKWDDIIATYTTAVPIETRQ